MSKERLEEIKKELELDWSDISYVVNQVDVKWLINRVEELEKEVEKQKNRKYFKMRQRDDFMKKAQHYKRALATWKKKHGITTVRRKSHEPSEATTVRS